MEAIAELNKLLKDHDPVLHPGEFVFSCVEDPFRVFRADTL